MVVQGHHHLSPVIGVHYADFIGRGQAAPGRQAAAGVDQPRVARGDLHCKARGHQDGLAGLEGPTLPDAGAQIRPGGVG